MEKQNINKNTATNIEEKKQLLTLSDLRRELDIPLILAKRLVVWGEIEAVHAIDGTIRITAGELAKARALLSNPWKKAYLFVRALGPGLITGASDDDPSGIGTYSSVGAQFGFSILWMAAWLLPIMLAVQEVCARIGVVTNKGLAGVLKDHYKKRILVSVVLFLIIANVVNIGADLGAMAASLKMLTGINFYFGAISFAILIIALEIIIQYHLYVKFLKWLTISVFAYIVTGIVLHPDWFVVFKEAFIPEIHFNKAYIFAMIAVFGTTITPYLFFWQASEEVEEGKLTKSIFKRSVRKWRLARMRTDVNTGMLLANIVFFFIVVTTAQALFKNGITNIDSAEQAALALRPLAGDYAYLLFALGIIGTGLLAVPILAGSGAYALAEIMNWREGLEERFSQAKGFYLVIAFSIITGLALNFLGINPILALYYAAFLNGIIAVPLLVVIMLVGNRKDVMGEETHPKWVKFFGWLGIIIMTMAIITSFVLLFK